MRYLCNYLLHWKQTPRPQTDDGNISPISKRLWHIENEQAFVSRMSSRDIQIRLTHFKTPDSVSSDEATKLFSNILTNAASDCNIKQTTPNNKTFVGHHGMHYFLLVWIDSE